MVGRSIHLSCNIPFVDESKPLIANKMLSTQHKHFHILVVDDNASVHADFKKILEPNEQQHPDLLFQHGRELFSGLQASPAVHLPFDVMSAYDGSEGLRTVEHSLEINEPFAVAFVDVRMPGGTDGIELVKRIWKISPDTQIVMCTAYTDFQLNELLDWAGHSDHLVILKKPFDNIEVLQLAHALTKKWDLMQASRSKMADLVQQSHAREEALQGANKILEAEIERHKQTEAKLDEARRLAEAALEARRAFLANVSHEIRTPLNGIMGMNELLLETDLDQEQQEYALNVAKCSESLLGIINDILDFAKIDAGQLKIVDEPFDLNLTIERAVSCYRSIATRVGLHFCEVRDADVPLRLIGDASRLEQILSQLLSNSIKFTHEGSIVFELSTEYQTDTEIVLKFTVKDTGVGIEPGLHDNLFQPFTQADGSATRNFGGTGLGLAICKNVVGLMRGHLDFESDGQTGSRFWFTLPFKKVNALTCGFPHAITDKPLSPIHAGFDSKARAHILVAEDSPAAQGTLRYYLELLGCATTIVDNGRQAIEAVASTHFDLIFLDCQMPEMDGFEAAYHIRQLPSEQSNVPIVALTARAIDEAREQCLAAGIDNFLCKPINRSDLSELLDEVLN